MRRLCIISLVWLSAGAASLGANIAPSSATGGPVPFDYTSNFSTWPAEPISIADLTDGSPATGVALAGHDGYLQDNGARVDTGTFYRLRYDLPLSAPALHIEFTASAHADLEQVFWVAAVQRNGHDFQVIQVESDSSHPRTFGFTLYRNYNDGNFEAQGRAWGLDDMQQADGSISFFAGGAFGTTLDYPGFVTSTLYEVTANIVPAPEPGTAILLAVGAAAAVALWRRRR